MEYKQGNKKATISDPAFINLNITKNGEIITRCVVKYNGKNWVKTWDDGKFHKVEFTEYMSQEFANEVFDNLWKLGDNATYDFTANKVTSATVEFYNDFYDVVENWDKANSAIITVGGVEPHTHEYATKIINNYLAHFKKQNKNVVCEYTTPLQEEDNADGTYDLTYTIWKK
jgi:hypothetical protein